MLQIKRAAVLAWKNLTHDLRKLFLAAAGVGFAVLLMFQQRGFNHALFDSTVELIRQLDGELILVSESRFALSSEMRFPRTVMDIAASCPGVASAQPVFLEHSQARLRRTNERERPIRVIAFDWNSQVFRDPRGEIQSASQRLHQPQTAIMDRLSKYNYGFDLGELETAGQSGELSGQKILMVGGFTMGRDFAHDGNLIMSVDNFRRYFRYRGPDPTQQVDLGVIRCLPDADPQWVRAAIVDQLPAGVMVLSQSDYVAQEVSFWARSTPIGMIFAIGSIMGFGVGVIICYQVLATDIAEHLGEFATLKAMGYGQTFFASVVLSQSLLLCLFGFIPGFIAALLLFQVNSAFTGLIMMVTPWRAAVIFLFTLIMCVCSGLLAMRKLLTNDPASLF